MKTRTEIHDHVIDLMSGMFDLDADSLTEDSMLYDELDIDSIDAVDLVVELKKYTGKKISPEDFSTVRTIGDIINAVEALLRDE